MQQPEQIPQAPVEQLNVNAEPNFEHPNNE